MYLKLNFTANVTAKTVWRLVTYITNDANITSISQLQSISTSQGWHPNVSGSIDWDTSQIIRTVDPVNTYCHISNYHPSYDNDFWFVMEQQVYDDPSQKYYIHYNTFDTNYQSRVRMEVSDSVNLALRTTAQLAYNISNADDARGTKVAATGSKKTYGNIAYDASLGSNIRTFSAYLTDTTFAWYTTSQATPVGFGTTFNTNTTYSGVFLNSQYQRFDHHNTPGNGVIPWLYTWPNGNAVGFGHDQTWNNAVNNNNIYGGHNLTAFNMVDARHRIGNTYPMSYFSKVAHTIGMHSSERYAMTALSTDTSGGGATYGKALSTTANERHVTSDLNGNGYGLLPLGWTNTVKGNMGGDITSLSNIYIFNGDYYPGDEFGVGEKTYIIWPGYAGYTNRIGIAIPKE